MSAAPQTPLVAVPDLVTPAGLPNASASIAQIAPALAAAQGAMGHASKDSTNPHFKRTYADLASVLDTCREPFAVNGLSFIQRTAMGENSVIITTILLHTSGEWISDTGLSVPVSKDDAQGVGGAITYGRRYTLMAMAGMAPDDDDGNAAAAAAPARQQAPAKLTLQQVKALEAKFIEGGLTPADAQANAKQANPANYDAAVKHADGLIAKRKATPTNDAAKCEACHGQGYNPKSEAEPCAECDGRGFTE